MERGLNTRPAGRNAARRASVGVFGATGHTGRFVVAELLRRGLAPVAVARDFTKSRASEYRDRGVPMRTASIADPASLDLAFADAAAVVNCAGPFLDTADAVAASALRCGAHYLDVTAEQLSAQTTLAQFDAPARAAGLIVMPAVGFYGGLADLMATAALGDRDSADEIRIGIALDRWQPTRGTRITGQRNTAPRMIVADGRLAPLPQPAPESEWVFPLPFGSQTMIEIPFSEIILIASHLRVTTVRTHLNRTPLLDLRDPATPPPEAIDESGRSGQTFLVDVVVRTGSETRRLIARGQDIYAFTAPLVCEAVERILAGEAAGSGAHAPGAVLDARSCLHALAPDTLTLDAA